MFLTKLAKLSFLLRVVGTYVDIFEDPEAKFEPQLTKNDIKKTFDEIDKLLIELNHEATGDQELKFFYEILDRSRSLANRMIKHVEIIAQKKVQKKT